MPVRLKIAFSLAIAALLAAAAWGQAPQPKWKDQAEYQLYDSITKEKDNTKRLELLNTWKEKYPDTAYKAERLGFYLDVYQKLNQPDKVLETGNEILAADPKNIQALVAATTSIQAIVKPTPEQLGMGEKAARTLVAGLDALRPPGVSDADWNNAKAQIEPLAYSALASIAVQRKDYVAAEKLFMQILKANPNNGQVSYSLGSVILLEKNAATQVLGLYHIARAASYAGPGAYSEQGRKQATAFLTKAYTSYHGSAEGLEELLKMASAQPFPPEGFNILSGPEVEQQKEEAFKKANPMLALWTTIKTELTGPNGQQYFESGVKGALLPGGNNGVIRFKGKLVSANPAKAPKQLVLAIADPSTPEVILDLDEPLENTAPVGTQLEFEGVAASYTASPFRLTFEVEKAKLVGWPEPAKRAPAAKKAGVAKKK